MNFNVDKHIYFIKLNKYSLEFWRTLNQTEKDKRNNELLTKDFRIKRLIYESQIAKEFLFWY